MDNLERFKFEGKEQHPEKSIEEKKLHYEILI
jgi:hypothetical protein